MEPPLPSNVIKPLPKSSFLACKVRLIAQEVPVKVEPDVTTTLRAALKLVVDVILFWTKPLR